VSGQAVGQLLVITGLVAWVASLCGLVVVGWLAAYCRQLWAATTSSVFGLALLGAGVFAFTSIPGSTQ
jgi:hypothetical protein